MGILIVEDDIKFINAIKENFANLFASGGIIFTDNLKQKENKNLKIDFVLFDSKKQTMSVFEFLNLLKWASLSFYTVKFQAGDEVKEYTCAVKSSDSKFAMGVLNYIETENQKGKFCKEYVNKDDAIRNKIAETLLTLGINTNLLGHKYLIDAVMLAKENPIYIKRLSAEIYPRIAEKFNSTPCKVERAIRNAIDVSYNKDRMKLLNDIFGFTVFEKYERPTNCEIIALLSTKIV